MAARSSSTLPSTYCLLQIGRHLPRHRLHLVLSSSSTGPSSCCLLQVLCRSHCRCFRLAGSSSSTLPSAHSLLQPSYPSNGPKPHLTLLLQTSSSFVRHHHRSRARLPLLPRVPMLPTSSCRHNAGAIHLPGPVLRQRYSEGWFSFRPVYHNPTTCTFRVDGRGDTCNYPFVAQCGTWLAPVNPHHGGAGGPADSGPRRRSTPAAGQRAGTPGNFQKTTCTVDPRPQGAAGRGHGGAAALARRVPRYGVELQGSNGGGGGRGGGGRSGAGRWDGWGSSGGGW